MRAICSVVTFAALLRPSQADAVGSTCAPSCTGHDECLFGTCVDTRSFSDGGWPTLQSEWDIIPRMGNSLEPPFPSSDPVYDADTRWMHLHRGSLASYTLQVEARNGYARRDPADIDAQLRYTLRDVPISPWLDPPFSYLFDMDANEVGCPDCGVFDTAFPEDGIFDVSVEMQGADKMTYQPNPSFAHVRRPGFATSTWVPAGIFDYNAPDDGGAGSSNLQPNVVYVNSGERDFRGYPANHTVQPWSGLPHENDLFVESLSARSGLFSPLQMWWADPAHTGNSNQYPDGLPFIRGMPPKHSEEAKGHNLRFSHRHERFPVKDGPRGVGWMSAYVSGQVDSKGRFAFAETSGRIAYMYPDGEIWTIAGIVTTPGKDPIWIFKPRDVVKQNQELRGQWPTGQGWGDGEWGGFRTPLDVAIDPLNEDVLYVVGVEDHCVWRVQINDLTCNDVSVTILAGDPNHTPGDDDGMGSAARFHAPTSIVFDPVRDVMYVADQERGRVRRVTRAGEVTTLFGQNNVQVPGNADYPWAPPSVLSHCDGDSDPNVWYNQDCAKQATTLAGTYETAAGHHPDIYLPQTIRVDSQGNIVLLEIGLGSIRQIHPITGATTVLARVDPKFREWSRGWCWMDVDRWGAAGDKDGIYWLKFVGDVFYKAPDRSHADCDVMYKDVTCSGSCRTNTGNYGCEWPTSTGMFNEVYGYTPPNNNDQKSYIVFNSNRGGYPQNSLRGVHNPPHYAWLVAVDPRGAVLFAGAGEHGVERMRLRRDDDVVVKHTSASWDYFDPFWQARDMYNGGVAAGYGQDVDPSIGGLSLHGSEAHNILGLADAWGLVEASDEELLAALHIPDVIRNSGSKNRVVEFLRYCSGTTSGVQPPIYDWQPGMKPKLQTLWDQQSPATDQYTSPPVATDKATAPATESPTPRFRRFTGSHLSQSGPQSSATECRALCSSLSLCVAFTYYPSSWCSLLQTVTGVKSARNTVSEYVASSCGVTHVRSVFDTAHADNVVLSKHSFPAGHNEHMCCDQCTTEPACVAFSYKWKGKCVLFSRADGATTATNKFSVAGVRL